MANEGTKPKKEPVVPAPPTQSAEIAEPQPAKTPSSEPAKAPRTQKPKPKKDKVGGEPEWRKEWRRKHGR